MKFKRIYAFCIAVAANTILTACLWIFHRGEIDAGCLWTLPAAWAASLCEYWLFYFFHAISGNRGTSGIRRAGTIIGSAIGMTFFSLAHWGKPELLVVLMFLLSALAASLLWERIYSHEVPGE